MVNPEPLDLGLQNKIQKMSEYIVEIVSEAFPMMKEDGQELKETIEGEIYDLIDKIKQRIKSACEFYLKYFNKPIDLKCDFLELAEEIDEVVEADLEHLDVYNRWLFKLAFKDVLGGDKK